MYKIGDTIITYDGNKHIVHFILNVCGSIKYLCDGEFIDSKDIQEEEEYVSPYSNISAYMPN